MIGNYNVSKSTWESLIPLMTSTALSDLKWELESTDEYLKEFKEVLDAEILERSKTETQEYKEFLDNLRTISPKSIIYIPGKQEYYQSIYDKIVELFEKYPELRKASVSASEDEEIYEQSYDKAKTEHDIYSVFKNIKLTDWSEDVDNLLTELRNNMHLFGVGSIVTKSGTILEIIWKRRTILQDTLHALEFLLDKYKTGASPETWRRLA